MMKSGALGEIELSLIKDLCENNFEMFVKYAWPILEPKTEFKHNWHIGAIAEHLNAVSNGEIRNLLINICPRMMKSLLVSVMWPAWTWIDKPEIRWMFATYSQSFAVRDSVKCRTLIQSQFYQNFWSDNFKLASDQNEKLMFMNNKTGYRLSTSVDGQATGEGADILVCLPFSEEVLTNKGYLKIGEIVENRLDVSIASYNHDLETVEFKEIEEYEKNPIGDRDLIEFDLGDGVIFECTEDHPVFVKDKGYIPAGRVVEGDTVLYNGKVVLNCKGCGESFSKKKSMQHRTVKRIKRKSNTEQQDVYNVRVADNHNYFCNGVLVHNCDDGNKAKDAHSKKSLETVNTWWSETMQSRLNDQKKGAKVIIQQRIAQNDLSGHVLEEGDYVHLSIPMEYRKKPAYSYPNALPPITKDPRTEDGELLWDERFGDIEVKKLRKSMGERAYATQYNQSPAPDTGDIFQRSWFRTYYNPPEDFDLTDFDWISISWDFTFKKTDDSDFVVGLVFARKGARHYLLDGIREKLSFTECLKVMKNMAAKYPMANENLVEDKANGPAIIDTLTSKIPAIVPITPYDSKEARARAVSPMVEAGNLYVPKSEYLPLVALFIEEMATFPASSHDDMVDSTSQYLNRFKTGAHWVNQLDEMDETELDDDPVKSMFWG